MRLPIRLLRLLLNPHQLYVLLDAPTGIAARNLMQSSAGRALDPAPLVIIFSIDRTGVRSLNEATCKFARAQDFTCCSIGISHLVSSHYIPCLATTL